MKMVSDLHFKLKIVQLNISQRVYAYALFLDFEHIKYKVI